ncbi:Chemotaxis protein CheY [Polystyrenella longa]|uniref:Chemotaxis protein CheY n=1 Tax=Polystyrenella longa TaxID=2528007 RepID=A0A518CPG8_9PLAN|nr:response regulator [Polystyrenella longa]QDU81127.1 Chemotaxis protein CheY [Polystyrenella longa]
MPFILVAEDSTLSRKMIVRALVSHGFEVIQARDGKEALKIFIERETELTCLVSDNLMPEMSGVELLAEVRKRTSEFPVIMASADIQKTTRAECDRLGISAFLNKPVQPEDLIAAVKDALSLPVC